MQVTIKNKEENKLLKRTEISGELQFESTTPSNKELTEALAKELKKDLSLVVVKNVYTEFSQRKATFNAVVYADAEAKEKFEMSTKHLRKQAEEDKKKAEEAKAAAEEKRKAEEAKAAEEAKKAAEKAAEEVKEEPAPAEESKEE
ncbi:MAG: hypothetical protein ABIG93_00570 [archaeon]|nr:hypothetical protein [Nanoarchaeota archaeon]